MAYRTSAWIATLVVGLVIAGAGIAHIAGVTRAALARGALFDTRHTELLLIGWTLVAPGGALVAFARPLRRGRTWAYPAALGVAAFLLVEFVLLGSTLGTPQQAVPAYAAGLGYLALVTIAWRGARWAS